MLKESIDSLEHSLKVDTGKLLRRIIKSEFTRKKYGHLPKMVTASKDSIGV